uniref:Protein kinase domain-containing protein n=1 Tax=Monopterus albus TaxID=43700 RepID=A0A3Q3KBM9_MONAL
MSTTHQDFIGEGTFGKVAKCLNLKNQEIVAIKIYKGEISKGAIQHEVAMLNELRALDPDKNNLVKFIDSFDCQNDYCVVFEMLNKSLWDLMVERGWWPLTLNEIRPIAQQLLVALNALKGLGIIHGDVKADNVMFVSHQDQPSRVKLIDFGLAFSASRAEVGMLMQARTFRAPEVFLGLPISEAIDMWGLGCIMALLYIACNLFPGHTAHQTMNSICQMLGQPMDHLLSAGTKTSRYFNDDDSEDDDNFDELYAHEDDDDSEELFAEKMEFLDFLKGVLHLDSEQRLTPSQGLQHNFITMAHLKDHCNTSYVEQARNFMTVCTNVNDLHETADCLSNSKKDSFTESSNEHRFSENVNTERFSHETIHAEKSGESVRQLNLTRNLEPDAECPSSCSNSIFSRGQEWDAQEILQDYMHLFTCYKDNVSAWTELESDSNSVMITESEWDAQKILQDYMDLLSAYKDEVSAWTKLESDSNHVMFSGENWAAQEISQDHSMHLSSLHHNEVSIPGMFTESDRDAQEILQDYMDLFTCCMSEVSAWNELESESNRGMLSGEN